MLIAVSILYMALENIVGAVLRRRWVIAFAFGLVHGFGFSFALGETLQFAGSHLVTSLVAFNVGVELGQILVLALLVPALHVLFRYVVSERIGTIVLSAFVAHTAWHWTMDRAGTLRQFSVSFDPGVLTMTFRVLIGMVVIAAVWWWWTRSQEDSGSYVERRSRHGKIFSGTWCLYLGCGTIRMYGFGDFQPSG